MLDTERLYLQVWQDTAGRLGFAADYDLLVTFVGLSVEECERKLCEAAGSEFPIDEFRALGPRLWYAHVKEHGITVKPGLLPMLDWLEEGNVPRAVVTSTFAEDAEASLRGAGIASRFEVVVSGDQVTHSKPAPDIYLLAAQRLGVEPAECVALEDSDAGVLAAAAAQMRVIMVPDMRQPSVEARAAAHCVMPSLEASLPLLKSSFQRP